MTKNREMDPNYSMMILSNMMWLFQCQPCAETKSNLMSGLKDYQRLAANGLTIPRTQMAPTRPARTLAEHYRRDLDEALLQFKVSPESGTAALEHLTDAYIQAVQLGRIKP